MPRMSRLRQVHGRARPSHSFLRRGRKRRGGHEQWHLPDHSPHAPGGAMGRLVRHGRTRGAITPWQPLRQSRLRARGEADELPWQPAGAFQVLRHRAVSGEDQRYRRAHGLRARGAHAQLHHPTELRNQHRPPNLRSPEISSHGHRRLPALPPVHRGSRVDLAHQRLRWLCPRIRRPRPARYKRAFAA